MIRLLAELGYQITVCDALQQNREQVAQAYFEIFWGWHSGEK